MTHKNAILGAKGFVGQTIASQLKRNEDTLLLGRGEARQQVPGTIDTLWCAAAPGSMIDANQNPEKDKANIETIADDIIYLKPKQIILISSIATLKNFGLEQTEKTSKAEETTPYGVNRALLERMVQDLPITSLTMRLPALFGKGLKKNAIFDLIHPLPSFLIKDPAQKSLDILGSSWEKCGDWNEDKTRWILNRRKAETHKSYEIFFEKLKEHNLLSWRFTNPQSTYQFYNMNTLVADAIRLKEAGIDVANMATHPVSVQEIARHALGISLDSNAANIHNENMFTQHASVFGYSGPYIATKNQVLSQVKKFIQEENTL